MGNTVQILIPLIGGPLDGEKHLLEDPDRSAPDELRFPVNMPITGYAEGGPATTAGPTIDMHIYSTLV